MFNVPPINPAILRFWAQLMYRLSDRLYGDAMISANAKAHALMVVTRNVRDFIVFDVPTFEPFAGWSPP